MILNIPHGYLIQDNVDSNEFKNWAKHNLEKHDTLTYKMRNEKEVTIKIFYN